MEVSTTRWLKPFPWKRRTLVSYIASAMADDDLATQGARASAAMVLSTKMFSRNIPISAPELLKLIFPVAYHSSYVCYFRSAPAAPCREPQ